MKISALLATGIVALGVATGGRRLRMPPVEAISCRSSRSSIRSGAQPVRSGKSAASLMCDLWRSMTSQWGRTVGP